MVDMFGRYVLKQYFCTRFRERNAVLVEILKQRWGFEPYRFEKKLFFKKTSKSFGSSKIVLTFASAFATKALKKSSLKDLDMNKQVVQVLLETK